MICDLKVKKQILAAIHSYLLQTYYIGVKTVENPDILIQNIISFHNSW